jgi:signal transduction histidine kinase
MKVKLLDSIRFDVFSKMTLMVLVFAVIGMGFSVFFLDDYYESMKVDSLIESAAQLKNDYYEEPEVFYSAAETASEKLGALYLIYDMVNEESVSNPMFESGRGYGKGGGGNSQNFHNDSGVVGSGIMELEAHDLETVIDEGYELIRGYNDRLNSEFLSIAFVLDAAKLMVLNVPLAVIDDSVMVARNFFLILSGLLFIIGSMISFFISKSITSPIIRLNDAVGDMADLKFGVFYEENRQDEIGMLGKSFNRLSTKLSYTLSQLNSANEQLKEDLSVIERSEKLREEFVNSASHELKTPIAVIQGYAEGLKELNDEEKRKNYLNVIVKESEKMDQLIRDLLNLSELESHYTQIKMENFELVELIEDELLSFQQLIREKKIKLSFNRKQSIEITADRDKIAQVIRNYLSNAIHHAAHDCTIAVEIIRLTKGYQLRVENSGDPIPQEKLSQIWSSFFKVDKARSREYGGTGLGLSIVRRICELHGFEYGAENTRKGVAFWINLSI